ncbi:formate dehydrogenase gamma subunit [Collimonas sp. OK242]|uniref:formate dehydrogenase subunit gamma n=1 Tax=Collimonas sp. OK242 TaxID=1798195 RepID=UPI000894F1CF|nr:formate dehydrogenase gamma subunit [Collimonas sp. OK242]
MSTQINKQITFDMSAVEAVIAQHKAMPGAMLPILHGIQESVGYIPSEVVQLIAQVLNVSRAEVHGVVTYYHHFRQTAPGRQVVQVCRAEACQAMGGDALAAHAKATLSCDFHETTEDGAFSLEPVYCLGQCACGPAIMIGDDLHARVSFDKFNRLLEAKRGAR